MKEGAGSGVPDDGRCQTALPTSAPIPAVSAIANAPQNVTRIVGLRISAPPALAPIIPSAARHPNDPTEISLAAPSGFGEPVAENESWKVYKRC